MPTDFVGEFHRNVAQIRETSVPFAVATIIRVEGSASAKVGSKAIFDQAGKNIEGWVGGGCAERFVGEQVVEAIRENKPRIILADLDDEILGLGVACGGKMHIFIEPLLPLETVRLSKIPKFEREIRALAYGYGWNVELINEVLDLMSPHDLFAYLSKVISNQRNKQLLRKKEAGFRTFGITQDSRVTIVGRSRITEALARHFSMLGFSVRAAAPSLNQKDYPSSVKCDCIEGSYQDIEFERSEIVIVASHTSQDPAIVEKALSQKASYTAMIGSQKRVQEVLSYLRWTPERLSQESLFIPAGLDIGAKNPEEIALSIAAEVVEHMEFL
ncbi:MAG: XdhC family protein [Pseudobdellovibrionaceae bacterium]